MHVETYPAFFTPRDKEPSLSSFEEKSSEFDWLEIKRTRKQKYIWKVEQVLCILLPSQNCIKDASLRTSSQITLGTSSRDYILWEQAPERLHSSRRLQTMYKGLFTLCSYLKTKESYDRWVTRRLWGFKHQISKAKYLKMSVAHIGKLHKNIAALCKMAAKLSG